MTWYAIFLAIKQALSHYGVSTIADILKDILSAKGPDGKFKIKKQHVLALIAIILVVAFFRFYNGEGEKQKNETHLSPSYLKFQAAWTNVLQKYRDLSLSDLETLESSFNKLTPEDETDLTVEQYKEISLASTYIYGKKNGTVAGWAKIIANHPADTLTPLAQFEEKSGTALVAGIYISSYFGADTSSYQEGVLSVDPLEFNDKLQIALTKLSIKRHTDRTGYFEFEEFARALVVACSNMRESDVTYIDNLSVQHRNEIPFSNGSRDSIEPKHLTSSMCYSGTIQKNIHEISEDRMRNTWNFFRIYIQSGNISATGKKIIGRKDPDIARIEITFSSIKELIIVADIIP